MGNFSYKLSNCPCKNFFVSVSKEFLLWIDLFSSSKGQNFSLASILIQNKSHLIVVEHSDPLALFVPQRNISRLLKKTFHFELFVIGRKKSVTNDSESTWTWFIDRI